MFPYVQTYLNLRWAQMSERIFSRVVDLIRFCHEFNLYDVVIFATPYTFFLSEPVLNNFHKYCYYLNDERKSLCS